MIKDAKSREKMYGLVFVLAITSLISFLFASVVSGSPKETIGNMYLPAKDPTMIGRLPEELRRQALYQEIGEQSIKEAIVEFPNCDFSLRRCPTEILYKVTGSDAWRYSVTYERLVGDYPTWLQRTIVQYDVEYLPEDNSTMVMVVARKSTAGTVLKIVAYYLIMTAVLSLVYGIWIVHLVRKLFNIPEPPISPDML